MYSKNKIFNLGFFRGVAFTILVLIFYRFRKQIWEFVSPMIFSFQQKFIPKIQNLGSQDILEQPKLIEGPLNHSVIIKMESPIRVTQKELCDYLGISKPTFNNWKKKKTLGSIINSYGFKKNERISYDILGLEKQLNRNLFLFKKKMNDFIYYDFVMKDKKLVNSWLARIAVKQKYNIQLTSHEIGFMNKYEVKEEDALSKVAD